MGDDKNLISTWKDEKTNGFHIDVRLFIEGGGEPYSIIMDRMTGEDFSSLTIHAPFVPKPLEAQLSRMGFVTRIFRVDLDHYCLEVRRNPIKL